MVFVKKPFLSRVVVALKDKEELKSPIVIKEEESIDIEITRLQKRVGKREACR